MAAHEGAAGSAMDRSTRELLRWLGVELFAEAHLPRGWRGFRAVHRHLLGRIEELSPVQKLVAEAWSSGEAPSHVAGAARDLLSGTFVAK